MKINPPFLAIVLLRREHIHRRIFSGTLKFRALGCQLLPSACLHSLKEVRRQTRQQCNSHPAKTMERINQPISAVILSKHILGHENIHCLISVQALEFQTLVTKYYRERVRSRLRSSKDKRGSNGKNQSTIFVAIVSKHIWVTNTDIVEYCPKPWILMRWFPNLYRERVCTRIKPSEDKRGNNALATL